MCIRDRQFTAPDNDLILNWASLPFEITSVSTTPIYNPETKQTEFLVKGNLLRKQRYGDADALHTWKEPFEAWASSEYMNDRIARTIGPNYVSDYTVQELGNIIAKGDIIQPQLLKEQQDALNEVLAANNAEPSKPLIVYHLKDGDRIANAQGEELDPRNNKYVIVEKTDKGITRDDDGRILVAKGSNSLHTMRDYIIQMVTKLREQVIDLTPTEK